MVLRNRGIFIKLYSSARIGVYSLRAAIKVFSIVCLPKEGGRGGAQHGREKKKEKLTKCGSFVAGFVKHSTTCSDNHVRMCVISDCGF